MTESAEAVDGSDPNFNTAAPLPTAALALSSSSSSSSGKQQPLSTQPSSSIPPVTDVAAFSSYFAIDSTVRFLLQHNAQHVALQLPDSLLPYSARIARLLSARHTALASSSAPRLQCYVLADTSYSACCVDVTAAQHCSADAIVHYGVACLSTRYSLPVYYVYGRAALDTQVLYDTITQHSWEPESTDAAVSVEAGGGGALLFCDLEYEWKIEELKAIVRQGRAAGSKTRIVVAAVQEQAPAPDSEKDAEADEEDEKTAGSSSGGSRRRHSIAGHHFTLPASCPLSSFSLLFVGSAASPLLGNLLLRYHSLPAFTYTPSASIPARILPCAASASVRRTLSRRFYLMQRAASASIIGILVATLSGSHTLPALSRVSALITAAGKRHYTVAVGRPSPAKLANFTEVELWVLLSCPFSALLQDEAEYWRHVVTPFELEMALKGKEWTGQYETDMSRLGEEEEGEREERKGGEEQREREERREQDGEGEVVWDSATGKLRQVLPTHVGQGGTALMLREGGEVAVRSAADAYRERSWKGLETERERRKRMEAEQDEQADGSEARESINVSRLQPGLHGIASGYSEERRRAATTHHTAADA